MSYFFNVYEQKFAFISLIKY